MDRELVLPPDFHDYAWEVESKGVFGDTVVRVDGRTISVTFFDPVRLSQEIEDELASRASVELRSVLVVPSVTEQNMRAAVSSASREFFA